MLKTAERPPNAPVRKKTKTKNKGAETQPERRPAGNTATRGRYLLLHVAMETQKSEPRENGDEESMEELDSFTTRDKDDDFVVVRKLQHKPSGLTVSR